MITQADRDAKRLIIGCGTGRCGTVSLVKFLNSQPGVSMRHEGVTDDRRSHHLVPWYEGEVQLWSWLTELGQLSGDANWYGDVGPYFLPYLPAIFTRYPESRAICLERSRRQVIKSYLKKTEGRNHWYRHKGIDWTEDAEWDPCFPWYAEPDKRKAVGLYWDQYHCMALEYRARFPDRFMLLPTAALNEAQGRCKILELMGYGAARVIEGQFHENATYKNRLKRSVARFAGLFGRAD